MAGEPLRIAIVAGARPNFMKVAPLVHAFAGRREAVRARGVDLRVLIVHTGQHYDANMSEVFFRELGIPAPDRHLGVGSGSHAEQTGRIMIAFEKVLLEEAPHLVVVVGDVNSTIACALCAKKMGIKVAHVEAGLRSFDAAMPEEINRKLTDAISDLLFVTEESGDRNLRAEGVPADRIFFVGNVMIDTLRRQLARIEGGHHRPSQAVAEFVGNPNRRYGVLTLHRPSNVDDEATFSGIWGAVSAIAREIPILFPVHPRTRSRIEAMAREAPGIALVDPVGYLDMLYAIRGASLVITDSGGLQEETTVLGVPCVTVRDNTERPVTLEIGTNVLAGTRPEAILAAARRVLDGQARKGAIPPYWDGRAAERIVDAVLDHFMAGRGSGTRS